MKLELGAISWKIGLLLIVILPMFYVAQFVILFTNGDQSNPVIGFFLASMHIVPQVVLTMACGAALCLLVRIEMHLRPRSEDKS